MGIVHVRAGETVAPELCVRPSGAGEALTVGPVFGEVVEETTFSLLAPYTIKALQ